MHLKSIMMTRDGSYIGSYNKVDPTKPFRCTVEVEGPLGKTELNLQPEVSDRIMAIIAEQLAVEARRVADAMTASFIETGTAQDLIA